MHRLRLQRLSVHADLLVARRRVTAYVPYSPAWDAAMARVEDLEREAWRLEQADAQLVPIRGRSESRPELR